MTLDDADIMTPVWTTSTVNHHGDKVIHALWVACIVRLENRGSSHVFVAWKKHSSKALYEPIDIQQQAETYQPIS